MPERFERRPTATLDPEFSWSEPRKVKTCVCGGCNQSTRDRTNNTRAARISPCHRFRAYTDGYCRNCGHSRACCER